MHTNLTNLGMKKPVPRLLCVVLAIHSVVPVQVVTVVLASSVEESNTTRPTWVTGIHEGDDGRVVPAEYSQKGGTGREGEREREREGEREKRERERERREGGREGGREGEREREREREGEREREEGGGRRKKERGRHLREIRRKRIVHMCTMRQVWVRAPTEQTK